MWNKIVDYCKENKVLLIILAVLIVAIIILCFVVKGLKDKNAILDNNVKAATETIDSLELKNGQLLYERQSFVCTVNELEDYIGIKKSEINELTRKLDSKIVYISDLEGQISVLSTATVDTVIRVDTSYFMFPWTFNDRWYLVSGTTELKNLMLTNTLNRIGMDVPLRVGLTEDWTIFVTSENPYVSFSNIEGAVLDKSLYLKQAKKKPWGISVYAGFNCGYDVIGKGFYAGPGIGIGVSYAIFSW